ncbi:heme-dependent oxidative N-demethylase family protein [Pseudooctadecabacter jejudonensis]|uniref:DUF3445 domain-containing protein n=1 Tax=Pseudooctadecabacter jejudonensis TaxID=1391910 RepID=A0A1Y5TAM1_9RHOB|nr:DUF3445 domain-containing protein [Pseudooctadecabacter jejudonensis]SLN59385.1 hypothetical protein PSJ8397_03154 [Pseudooctadecabacter jejudonensis]
MDAKPTSILQKALPEGQAVRAAARLPSMQPVVGPWLFCDDAYGAQMVERRRLLDTQLDDVCAMQPDGLVAARSFLNDVLGCLPEGFALDAGTVRCPDGTSQTVDWDQPLQTVGRILQQDVCILEKRGDEHVLTGAVLCFPASWTLAEKIGRPLVRIHRPVADYDAGIAARVQRLFDGVQRGRPMWRANLLRYSDPALFQPRLEVDKRPVGQPDDPFIRSERQTVLRLEHPDAVAFVIHTTLVQVRSEKDH